MRQLESVLRAAVDAMDDAGAAFALIGGLAVSVRTEPRFTRDADLAVAVSDDTEAEAIVRQCQAAGFGIHAVVEQTATRRLASVRKTPAVDPDGALIDLLFASSGVEPEIVAAADRITILPHDISGFQPRSGPRHGAGPRAGRAGTTITRLHRIPCMAGG